MIVSSHYGRTHSVADCLFFAARRILALDTADDSLRVILDARGYALYTVVYSHCGYWNDFKK